MLDFIQFIKRPIRSNASAILFVSLSAVGADKFDEPKLLKSKAKKRFRTYKQFYVVSLRILHIYEFGLLTTRLPITTVARKNGIQDTSPTNMQSHIDSIHSPHNTLNTIINECIKSIKFHLGTAPSGNLSTLSGIISIKFLFGTVMCFLFSFLIYHLLHIYLYNFCRITAFP